MLLQEGLIQSPPLPVSKGPLLLILSEAEETALS